MLAPCISHCCLIIHVHNIGLPGRLGADRMLSGSTNPSNPDPDPIASRYHRFMHVQRAHLSATDSHVVSCYLCATLRVFKNVLKDQTWLAALFLIWCITWSDTLAEPDVSVAAASSTSNTINVHNFKATTLADASMGDAVLLDFGDGCVGYGVFLRFNRERPQSRSRAR